MIWDVYIKSLLIKTVNHCDEPEETNLILKNRWDALVEKNHVLWLSVLATGPITAEDVDEADADDDDFDEFCSFCVSVCWLSIACIGTMKIDAFTHKMIK